MATITHLGVSTPRTAASGGASNSENEVAVSDGYAGSVPSAEEIYGDHPAAGVSAAGLPKRDLVITDDALLFMAIGVAIGCLCCAGR